MLALRPVEVVDKRSAAAAAVVSRSDLRVEGLTLEEVITILQTVG
jgi:hypothetical protein